MRVLLAGASGLIGQALANSLIANGDLVKVLVRRAPRSAHEVEWQPATETFDRSVLEGIDAVVCLSGAGVGDHRWTASYRQKILSSRTSTVGTLARAVAAAEGGPAVFVSASAVGFYGGTADSTVDESAPLGSGFLAEVCRAWEDAASPARDAGCRTVLLRSGVVLARRGPVLARMLPLFRLGLGGRLGSGKQYWPWITLADEVAAIRFLLTADDVHGPVNVSAPNPVTNAEFTATLARVLHRPAILPVPGFALHAVLGGFAGDILASQRVVPAKLTAAGFTFAYADLEGALRAELGR